MTIHKNILSAIALSGILFASHASTSLAGESQRFKPIQGLSFDAGQKHGVGYFLSEAGTCKLVLTLASNQGDPQDFTVTRYETAIPAGQITRYTSQEGKAFEFGCQARAETMTFKPLSSIASSQSE